MTKRTTTKKTTRKASSTPRKDLYQSVTDRIIEKMESCTDPWKRPWISAGRNLSTPINFISRKPYRGMNIVTLWDKADAMGYQSAEWGTFQQWLKTDEDGKAIQHVRKGEKGTQIFYFKKFDKDENDPESKGGVMMREYTVFNASQIEGYEAKPVELPRLVERDEKVEAFLRHLLTDYQEGYDRAYYSVKFDHVRMPSPDQFRDTDHGTAFEHFYSTRFHEEAHRTGHESRLKRDMEGGFGSKKYAREELVAEMTAAFACAHLGISPTVREDHAVYLKSWAEVLKEDKKAIFAAASAAQKAMDWMIERQPKQEADDGADHEDETEVTIEIDGGDEEEAIAA